MCVFRCDLRVGPRVGHGPWERTRHTLPALALRRGLAERLESLKDHSAFDHSPFGQQPLPWGGEPITVCLSFLCSKGEKEV